MAPGLNEYSSSTADGTPASRKWRTLSVPQFGAAAPKAWSFATEVIGHPIDWTSPGASLQTFLQRATGKLSRVATSSGDSQLILHNMFR